MAEHRAGNSARTSAPLVVNPKLERTNMPDLAPEGPAGPRISRRSLLLGGAAFGLTAITPRGLGSARAFAPVAVRSHLVPRYRPKQPTGWPSTPGQSFSETIGGHRAFEDFTYDAKRYRISLLGFRKPGDSPDPIYESIPNDPTLAFKRTLAKAFGAHYAFRYVGGFKGRSQLRIESYSVFVQEPTDASESPRFGAGIYIVYLPDVRQGDPPADDRVKWIQVVRPDSPGARSESVVDNLWRANPYYLYGGVTSIYGTEVVNFHDVPQTSVRGSVPLSQRFRAEAFLVQDTGRRDASGRDVVNIFGGVRWGWQVDEI